MFGFLKNLFGGKLPSVPGTEAGGSECASATAPHAYSTDAGNTASQLYHSPGYGTPTGVTGSPGANGYGTQFRGGHRSNTGRGVEMPLQPILDGLPLELQPKVRQAAVGNQTVHVPLERILPQLSQGAVKLQFGELRMMVPQIFAVGHDLDNTLITLPLSEVLTRVNPALLRRRRVQKSIHVPDEISSPFDARSRSLAPPAVETPHAPALTPPSDSITRMPAGPETPQSTPRLSIPATPTAPAPPAAIPMPSRPVLPSSRPITPIQPSSDTSFRTRQPTNSSTSAEPPSVTENPSPKLASGVPLTMTLAPLAEAWPEPVRKEIVQLGLVDAKVALPMELIDRALRQGRVSFTWRMVRAWLRPSPPPSVSPNDGTILELPLKIVAPLFLAKQREASKPQAKLTVDEDIPNLFFGFPQPDSAPGGAAATARSSDTNYYVRDELDGARVAEPGDHAAQTGPSAGTRFVTKYATPNEIVSRAAALDGVAGALIALPDGLLVASRIPGDFNPDTLAAFLPQIFSKVSQCTKELRMGDLNNLNFTVGNVPWKIFRVNAIYFAAFGRAAEAMPTSQLAALAAELDHKPR